MVLFAKGVMIDNCLSTPHWMKNTRMHIVHSTVVSNYFNENGRVKENCSKKQLVDKMN